MKSAYIITMHCPLNYGAILQTYALQTYLKSLGLKVGIIDYRPNYIVCDQSLMYVGGEQYKSNFFKRWGYRLMKAPSKLRRRKNFLNFAKKMLYLTPEYKTYEDIKKATLDADYFFCGSDQIWNVVSGAHKDPSYFLGFVPMHKKKISYAASGNLPLTDEVKNITFPMIENIDYISMRENSTIDFIQPFISKPITHVCDPVFLLDGEIWRSLYIKYSTFNPKEKYLLVYPMGNGADNTIFQARKVANQMKLPLYMISASKRKDSRIDKQLDVDPYTFLSLIDNAEFVITNSFHGTSFSIILKKEFWTCVAEGSNQRISSLLEKAGLSNRLLVGKNSPDFYHKIDFDSVNQSLRSYIIQSQNFIKKSIYE